jgi:uncharacterized protein YybS (DUF2232 family)
MLLTGTELAIEAVYAVALGCGLLYFFQGLAVLIHMLDKWKVPLYLRLLILVILVLQSYSLLFLAVVGVADVWLDFRQRHQPDNGHVD